MWIRHNENKSFNFVAPKGMLLDQEVLFPCWEIQTPAFAAALAVAIKQQTVFITPVTLTGVVTVNLTIDAQVTPGAILVLKLTSDGTGRDVTPGTGFLAPVVAGVISKTKVATYIYNGTAYVPMGAAVQVD